MTEITTTEMLEQFKKHLTEITQYKSSRDRMKEFSTKLLNISKEIESIAISINPTINISIKNNSRGKHKQIYEDLFEVMQNGTAITRVLIEKAYPSLEMKEIANIMQKIAKMKGVEKTKDGRTVKFFLKT